MLDEETQLGLWLNLNRSASRQAYPLLIAAAQVAKGQTVDFLKNFMTEDQAILQVSNNDLERLHNEALQKEGACQTSSLRI